MRKMHSASQNPVALQLILLMEVAFANQRNFHNTIANKFARIMQVSLAV